MPTPQITITGNLENLLGQLDNGGSVVFTLVGYGPSDVPRVATAGVIVLPTVTALAPAGSFSVTLWGNDVITPANTFYQVDFFADTGAKLQTVLYQFTGSGSLDLSNVAPLNTLPTPSPITAPPNAVLTNPTAGQTISGQPLTVTSTVTASGFITVGNVSAGSLTVSGNGTVGGTLGVTGAATLSSLNTIIFADQQSGSDMCAKIIAAATAIQNGTVTASTILVPAGTFVCTTQLLFPNDGGSPPRQKSIKIVGAGAGGLADNNGGTPNGGTVLDMQFSATTGKIDTRGLGKLEVTGITFKDSASDGTPFVFTTNTIISFHNNQFYGNCSVSPKQDVFILGGSTNTIGGGATAAFQGYGTVITSNQADCIGRFALLDVFANAIQITTNHIFGNSGLTTGNGAAIELNPATSTINGNYIAGNLIEVFGYVYGINLVKSSSFNTIIGNSCFDHGASTVACINVGLSASNFGNQIIDGNADSALLPIHGNTPSLGLSVIGNQCAIHGVNGSSQDVCLAAAAPSSAALIVEQGLIVVSGTTFTGSDVGPGTLVAANSAAQTFSWSCNGTATSSSTLFLNTISTGALTCTDTGALGFIPAGSPGLINNLNCATNHPGVNASSGVVTVRKNGVTQALTCTLGTVGKCSDTTHSFSVAAGDLLTIQYTTQAAEVLATLACTVEKH